jgi:hypothetical protein
VAPASSPPVPCAATSIFKDNVRSHSTDEPAIDLTATSPLAFAGGWSI